MGPHLDKDDDEARVNVKRMRKGLPPTPPSTEDEDGTDSGSTTPADTADYPLPPPSIRPSKVLDVDANTPDGHVARDPRLIRLTGVHPFNVEAPLSALFNEGFLTSPELFYVRNHGAVPQVQDEDLIDWEFTVEGMVEKPLTITLRELLSTYDQKTYPITLVCAGNRRKEQNQVRKTKGFSWGAAGVSTALWTGVSMSDVIRRARPSRKARFVCMEGADKLPNGYYGTSVKLNWVMDPNRGIMLAYKMNGEMLTPDHGKPLRAVVPGQIGGRSVKWLKKLIITDAPSENWYHIWDNRVLPTMISPDESANKPGWWHDDRYAIYDLNVNSAIAYPAHDEVLPKSGGSETYNAQGYAYAGGGRRITRVEVTLDKGRTWRLANISYPEDAYRESESKLYGGQIDMFSRETCFCWCFWELDIPTEELRYAKDLLVRAMDEAMSVQPRDMYWSVLGMMNNPWFRVAIIDEGDSYRFEHPTQPALQPGGWMERVKKAGGNLSNGFWGERIGDEKDDSATEEKPAEEIKMTKDGLVKTVTIDELRKHDGAENPWFALNGEVYDGTGFLKEHPGGAQSIISAAQMDVTDEFMAIHSETAKAMMPAYHVGTLDDAGRKALSEGPDSSENSGSPREVFLEPRTWTKALLCEKKIISWDTRLFYFKLEHETQKLGLPTGQHLMVRLRDPVTREAIIRAYTPTSEATDEGMLELLVKVYFDTEQAKGGKMTKALEALPMGHFVDFKGPIGKFEYKGRGLCTINGKERRVKSFCMICAGSGLTPIFQVLRAVMQDREDSTQCVVLDGNRLVEDILCREQLDKFATENVDKCKLIHTLSKAPDDWTGRRGRITGDLVAEFFDEAQIALGETLVLICGPGALEKSLHSSLGAQGWRDEDLLFF